MGPLQRLDWKICHPLNTFLVFTNNTQAQSGRQPNLTNISLQETSLQEKLSLVGKPEWNEMECAHSQPARGEHYNTFPLTGRTKEIEGYLCCHRILCCFLVCLFFFLKKTDEMNPYRFNSLIISCKKNKNLPLFSQSRIYKLMQETVQCML